MSKKKLEEAPEIKNSQLPPLLVKRVMVLDGHHYIRVKIRVKFVNDYLSYLKQSGKLHV